MAFLTGQIAGGGPFTVGKGVTNWVPMRRLLEHVARSGIAMVLNYPQEPYGPQVDHCCGI